MSACLPEIVALVDYHDDLAVDHRLVGLDLRQAGRERSEFSGPVQTGRVKILVPADETAAWARRASTPERRPRRTRG
jgi:hypothetical protein